MAMAIGTQLDRILVLDLGLLVVLFATMWMTDVTIDCFARKNKPELKMKIVDNGFFIPIALSSLALVPLGVMELLAHPKALILLGCVTLYTIIFVAYLVMKNIVSQMYSSIEKEE